ncbi:MAG: LD-carboxypeptidase, partial [Bdellovibrionales bacterium]|nr:LD-carboxypeptidase [Bdellovibrionales bacterium]
GTARILEALKKIKRPKYTKLVLGLSDITALHVFLNQDWGWPTLHAPVLARFGAGRAGKKEVREVLEVISGYRSEIVHPLRPLNMKARRFKSKVSSPVRGGNLIVLQSLIGTDVHPKTKGCLLFLEEVGERGYRVDRALNHLWRAGVFEGVRGVILGDFVGGDEPSGKNFVTLALKEFAAAADFPVWGGIRSGHGPLQRPVAFETPTIIERVGGKIIMTQQTGSRRRTDLTKPSRGLSDGRPIPKGRA